MPIKQKQVKITILEKEALDKLNWDAGQRSENGHGFVLSYNGKKYTWFVSHSTPNKDIIVFLTNGLNAMLNSKVKERHSAIFTPKPKNA